MDEMHDNGRTIDAAGAAQTLPSLFDAGSHSAPATPQSTLRSTAPLRGAPSGRGAADAPAPKPRREALPQTGAREPNLCREALPLLGEVAQSAEGVSGVESGAGEKRESGLKSPLLRAHFARLCAEADALHRADPGFDLDSALRDPAFVRLTAPDVGVPVADAWYALHRREYAETLRRESLEQAAAAVASGSLRPREGGRASGGELLGTDPRHMTAAQRAELRDRIKRGERVYPR